MEAKLPNDEYFALQWKYNEVIHGHLAIQCFGYDGQMAINHLNISNTN
ncbi:hypothetical protein [Paenibacillus sp. MMS18-CY102]|nr:hypothetical protein [Paenibacillus sp. MMS18-CY102]MWC27018.1 hypothetical protein [Paenibacillus sp. MMS18-CY102]